MTKRIFTEAQIDRLLLLTERKLQLLSNELNELEAEQGLEPSPEVQSSDGSMEIGDVVEMFGSNYQLQGYAANGNALLTKIKTEERNWRPGNLP